jgi:hypothetical protein
LILSSTYVVNGKDEIDIPAPDHNGSVAKYILPAKMILYE